jgi:SAM-dependent methyltransferase
LKRSREDQARADSNEEGCTVTTFTTGTEAYAQHVGRYSDALARAMIERVGLEDGDRALDVGCGPGALLAALADRLGADHVAGVEPSPPFAEMARQRVPGAEVRGGSAEELSSADRTFDVVLSQLVVNFMTDARRGVQEMTRVARRTVASCVWDYRGEMTMLRAFWDAALELDPDAPDEGRTMRWATPAELEDLWWGASLRSVNVDALVVAAKYDGFDDFWAPFPAGIGPTGASCASLPPSQQAALREACRRRLQNPTGPFELTARAWLAIGQVG